MRAILLVAVYLGASIAVLLSSAYVALEGCKISSTFPDLARHSDCSSYTLGPFSFDFLFTDSIYPLILFTPGVNGTVLFLSHVEPPRKLLANCSLRRGLAFLGSAPSVVILFSGLVGMMYTDYYLDKQCYDNAPVEQCSHGLAVFNLDQQRYPMEAVLSAAMIVSMWGYLKTLPKEEDAIPYPPINYRPSFSQK